MKAWLIGFLAATLFGAAAPASVCLAAEPELVMCSYYSGGGMAGGHIDMSIWVEQDGTVKAALDSKETNGAPTIRRELTDVPREKLDELAAMFSREDIFRWENSPKSEIEMLDGDTVHVNFRYADKREAGLYDYLKMPREAFEAMGKVKKFLEELLKDAPEVESGENP